MTTTKQGTVMSQKTTRIGINPNTSFLKTLRNSGYNNYTAIADIVDNSLDNEVDATEVKITTKSFGNEKTGLIQIADNGCGMDFSTLNEALKLGSNTGKDAGVDLGCYGTGMKAAALSLGKKFTLFTKSKGDVFYIVEFDIEEIEETKNWDVPCRVGSDEEYNEFKTIIGSETGTILEITKLDRLSQTNTTIFNQKLKKDFGLIYNIFINERNVSILINGELVQAIDPMWRDLIATQRLSELNQKFTYKDKVYIYNAYHIAKVDQGDKNKDSDIDITKIGRTSANAGIYIYRNSRLVGGGLGLGIINKTGDSHLAGLRIELFIDGNDDYIFGSNFLKMVQEKNKSDIEQGFIDKLEKEFKEYWITSKVLNGKDDKLTEDVEMKTKINKASASINTNPHIKPTIEGGKNKKIDEPVEKKPTINVGKNKPHTRKREYGFCDFSLESFGVGGTFARFLKIGGKAHVQINVDHLFYQEFLSKCDDTTLGIILRLLVSFNLAKIETTWHNESEKTELFDEFFLKTSELLRTMIKY